MLEEFFLRVTACGTIAPHLEDADGLDADEPWAHLTDTIKFLPIQVQTIDIMFFVSVCPLVDTPHALDWSRFRGACRRFPSLQTVRVQIILENDPDDTRQWSNIRPSCLRYEMQELADKVEAVELKRVSFWSKEPECTYVGCSRWRLRSLE